MSTNNTIPSAGPDLEHLLAQEVVIEAGASEAPSGAQRITPSRAGATFQPATASPPRTAVCTA